MSLPHFLCKEAHPPAWLALTDGTVLSGYAIGALGRTTGEVVFNTAMTGYQEILTDPSYCQQIVTLTYPHIGNVGINKEDAESSQVQVAGLVIRDLSLVASNFRSEEALTTYLKNQGIVAIAGVDTRQLTSILREKGAQPGAIVVGDNPQEAVDLVKTCRGLAGMDLAKIVSTKKPYEWYEGEWALGAGYIRQEAPLYHVVAFDFGVKHNILRMLATRGCRITVLPAEATYQEALDLHPDGIFLSNGPGDPEPCSYAIDAARQLIELGLPTFGICLGHQIMALACGAQTIKMKCGHHGANHPVQNVHTKKVFITSQNHGFAVDANTLPANCRVTHVSLFDGSLQGFERLDKPAFCFQGHPEASPGPHEIAELFDHFIDLIKAKKGSYA